MASTSSDQMVRLRKYVIKEKAPRGSPGAQRRSFRQSDDVASTGWAQQVTAAFLVVCVFSFSAEAWQSLSLRLLVRAARLFGSDMRCVCSLYSAWTAGTACVACVRRRGTTQLKGGAGPQKN